jgi:hypothetical protein
MTKEKSTSFLHWLTDNLFSRAFFSLAGLVAAGITIFLFFQEKNINLEYQILTSTNVFDLNADVSDLDVTYDSTSLKKSNENLKIATIKVINTGNEDILKSYFDQNAPIGISIQNGRIIEKPELIEWSDEYLEQNFKVEYESSSSVTFSNVILEQNEFVTLKFLILHKTEETPTWHSLGKIAGQKIISINSVQDSKTETPFFEKAFYGAIGIQLARLFGYFFGLILIVVLIAIIGATLSDFFEGKKRKKWINEFIKGEEYQYNRMDDAIFERFEEDGISNFRRISYLTNDELKLNSRYNKALKELKEEKEIDPSLQDRMVIEDNFRSDWSLVNELINDGLVLKEGKKLLINNPMKQTLESFIEFLKSKGEFRKKRHHSNSRRLAIPSE